MLKWVGGKSWFVEKYGEVVLDHLRRRGGYYIEPFLGGGAMALFMGPRYPKKIVLGDVVAPLIEFYQALQTDPVELAYTVAQIGLEYGLDERAYYAVRAEEPTESLFRAARFLYLNRLCFNGLWRENAEGKMNTPAGSACKSGKAKLPERRAFEQASKSLELAEIRCDDFETLINEAEPRDFLYIDSPYYDTFTDYSKGGFGVPEQERLALALYSASERGVTFLAHNALSPEGDGIEYNSAGEVDRGVRYWYDEFATVIPIDEPRRVAANGDRAAAPCCLITNDESLARSLA